MNKLQSWLLRVWSPPHRDMVREMREFERTVDDEQTNSPTRQKQALRRAPERK